MLDMAPSEDVVWVCTPWGFALLWGFPPGLHLTLSFLLQQDQEALGPVLGLPNSPSPSAALTMSSGSSLAGETPLLTSSVCAGQGGQGWLWDNPLTGLGHRTHGWPQWGLHMALLLARQAVGAVLMGGGVPAFQMRCCPSLSCEDLAHGTTEEVTSFPPSQDPQVGDAVSP